MDNEYPTERPIPLKYFTTELANQLIDTKTSIDEVKGIATISGKRDGKYLSFVIEQRDHDEIQLDASDTFKRKSDYKEEIKRLHKMGLKQKEIALRLNMSQSFVSRLLNRD
ncbi:MAG: hypothetical protein IJG33_08305 [Selenomonadaceae bacterium]|nr:hypothetical protein [Selenomonadaceae bacterium]